jgi:hypothetical protein
VHTKKTMEKKTPDLLHNCIYTQSFKLRINSSTK